MAKLTAQERKVLRTRFGTAYFGIQQEYRENHSAIEIVPEMIGAMLALAVFVAREAGITREGALRAALRAIAEEYGDDVKH